ncbi:MAG: TetR/AcrR family transcriptional regulator [candidate division Zixibacteria bacterium]|nr:TetR/AcrR family transcriptional regulator [candidate division Zixibacteria bacterium]
MDTKIERTKRENILSTAQKLFTRFGLRKTTVEEIIRLTKIAKGTFYKYFPGKEALFLEVVEKESASLVTAISEAVSQCSNSQEKMKTYLNTKAYKIADLVNFYQVTREGIDEYWPRIDKIREKYLSEERKIVREILSDGINNGEIEIADPELTAYAIVIAVKGLESKWMMENSPVELEESVDLLLSILFRGILKR